MLLEHYTQSTQDYLKHIFELTEDGSPASTTELAKRLGVAPASVTGMVQKLAATEPPLVIYHKHQGVSLTPAGERTALEVVRHHRLLETWLVQSLGYSWDEVHEEACRLEHVISEEFEERMAKALGNPTHDPHGDPIPDASLAMPKEVTVPLSSLRPEQSAIIRRVNDEDPDLLRHLNELGLVPGAQLTVKAYSQFDDNLTLKVGRRTAVLGASVTSKIYVEEV